MSGHNISIDAEPVAEHLRNTALLLDTIICSLGERTRAGDDVDGARTALVIVRRRLWDAIQRLGAGSAA